MDTTNTDTLYRYLKASTVQKRKPRRSQRVEHSHQVAIFEWAYLNKKTYPGLEFMFAVPNGEHRHISVAARLKDEGVKRGVPDIFLPVPRGQKHGLWIEMKQPGQKLRPEQQAYKEFLVSQGYRHETVFSCEEGIALLRAYLLS